MEMISLVLSLVSVPGLLLAAVLLRGYLPAYVAEKGKNAASKEDLRQLTETVEAVKALHFSGIERLKAGMISEGHVVERCRHVYEEMCSALRVFISGHSATAEAKERFHVAYAAAWLWASDDVLSFLNEFVALQIRRTAHPQSVDQTKLKEAYASVVIAMRMDVGFPTTGMEVSNYQFVRFD
jgi:hypothetical protein